MRLILTGATGVVGSAALNHILNLPKGEISALYILSRSPVPMAENQPNVTVFQHKNFSEYPPDLLEKLKGADGCIWAQGISQTLVSKEWVEHCPSVLLFDLHVFLTVCAEIMLKSHSITLSLQQRRSLRSRTRSTLSTYLGKAYVYPT